MVQVTATEYKHNALKLLEQVRVSGETVRITKRGKPIAQLTRLDDTKPKLVMGQFRGDATIVGDIIGPMIDPEDYSDDLWL